MQYIIYKFTNKINNKAYVGLTTQSLERRVYLHFWKSKRSPTSHFHKALAKYARDSWTIEVLEQGHAENKQFIASREVAHISEQRSYVDGYNSTNGGEDFSSSEYQRELQKHRVASGTHPFCGGHIQRESMRKRHAAGEFKGQNDRRVAEGSHNFVGDTNPQKRLAAEGRHHNQQKPWNNTKASEVWKIADKLYDWYQSNHQKKRGGSYRAMEKAFGLETSIQSMYYGYFQKGWNPREDIDWIEWITCCGS